MGTDNIGLDHYTQESFCKIFAVRELMPATAENAIHRHDFFQIVLLESGAMDFWLDFSQSRVEAPFATVIFPNQAHHLGLEPGTKGSMIMFDDTVFCSALLANELKEYNVDLKGRINHVPQFRAGEWEEIQSLLHSIRRLIPQMNMIRKMQVKFLIKVILLKLIDSAPAAAEIGHADADQMIYQKFRDKVDRNFRNCRTVKFYTDELGISGKKLTSICSRYAGQTPLEIIHGRLGSELKKAIVNDNLLLKEIAFQFGFSSQSALNKFIERQFGCSPQKWKAQLQKSMMGKHLYKNTGSSKAF